MKRFLLAVSALIAVQAFAQLTPAWSWLDYGRGSSWDDASSIASDFTTNHLYGTGYFSSPTCIFGSDTLTSNGQSDLYLVKYDYDGTYMWSRSFGGTDYEYGMSIACDGFGNVVVVGNFSSATIVFDNDTLTNLNAGTPDMFIAKFDPNGNCLWARRAGGNDWDNCAAVDINNFSNNIYVAGAYYSSNMSFAGDTLGTAILYDMVLMKFDANGNEIWARAAGGNYNDLANAVSVGGNEDVYISGGFASDSLPLMTTTLVNAFGSMPDIFAVKYSSSGTEQWALRWGSADNDHSVAIMVDGVNEVTISGHYHSTSFVAGNDTLTNMGMGDVFVIRIDAFGNVEWGRTFGGSDHDFGYALVNGPQEDVYVTGMFMSMNLSFGSFNFSNASMNEDMFIMRYDQFGNETWGVTAGGTGRDYINDIETGFFGLYIAGGFGSTTLTVNQLPTLVNTDNGGTGEALFGRLEFPSGIDEQNVSGQVQVYPNPGQNIFTFNSRSAIRTITIYNSLGEIVTTKNNINTQQYALDLSSQSDGIYFYSIVKNDGDVVGGTMVKQK